MNIIKNHIEVHNLEWNSNAIAITMKEVNCTKAKLEKWLKIFNLPDWVDGRTSITSSVGLPLALINQDISNLLEAQK